MNKRMDETRFAAILAAYGAEARRWPQAEREAALAFMQAHADLADGLLAEARATDGLLGGVSLAEHVRAEADQAAEMRALSRLLPAMNAGIDKVVSLPAPRRAAPRPQSLPWLWTGIGLAACVAGAAVGAHLSLMSIGDMRAQTVLAQVQIIDGDNN
ncbi:hypothetical protein [Asticcacaulis sp. EMRT-3]|uniref:hypothetical protein n=1 Tax=Asticcacaulis sp. EMRT-3 TaxID=3040349 RepID=UPI0024AEFC57|nr:hypothetical protein [Asticcacaulis sp. EMRT-3]MDI7775361.1 hypothetical protein [Asticcacaulis sp. EMRT-3]